MPPLASTNSSGLPTAVTVPLNADFAFAPAADLATAAVVPIVSGACRPTEVPANVPSGAACTTKSPP